MEHARGGEAAVAPAAAVSGAGEGRRLLPPPQDREKGRQANQQQA